MARPRVARASKTRPAPRRWEDRFTKEDAMTRKTAWTVLLSALLVAGCSQSPDAPPTKSVTAAPAADGTKYVLAQEPADAKGVKDLRAAAKDGDDVVLVGRIGGNVQPWIKGRAGFWVIDTSFVPCNERPDDA